MVSIVDSLVAPLSVINALVVALCLKCPQDVRKNLEMLEEYRSHLYEFETDFVFSCVTEVPQYQNLYDRMTRAFSLETMYKDVHEPLTALSDVRRISNEEKQQNRDKNMNRALVVLSLLSLFSALVDSFDFIQSFFGWFLNDTGVKVKEPKVESG